MNLWIAAALGAAGIFLVMLSTIGLRNPTNPSSWTGVGELLRCDAPAPDDSVRCDQEAGHYGWHRYGATEWFGDSWDCDHWASTQLAPTQAAPPVEQRPILSAEKYLKYVESSRKKLVEVKPLPEAGAMSEVEPAPKPKPKPEISADEVALRYRWERPAIRRWTQPPSKLARIPVGHCITPAAVERAMGSEP